MSLRLLRLLLVSLALLPALLAEPTPADTPEPYRSLPPRLQARRADFPEVPAPTDADALEIRTVPLNRAPEVFDNGQAFAAVRFRAPDKSGLDLVWAFSTPSEWRHWYIMPAEGETSRRGFKNWLNGDRAYLGFDCSVKTPVTLQTLDADYFEPGREYLLWFSQNPHTPAPAELKLVLRFAPRPEAGNGWDRAAVEETLRLEAAPADAQAAYFSSRGARVLLDRKLFHPDDATSQMENFLFTRRQTEFARDGYYITVESTCPPCHSSPKLADIIARHGHPDLSLSAAQQTRLRRLDGTKSDSAEPLRDRHHFDYFVFETDPDDPSGAVIRVSSQFFDTSSAKPTTGEGSGGTWTEATILGHAFRLFFKDGRETARYIDWDKPYATALSEAAPAGEYLRRYPSGEPMEKLVHDGSGAWTYESYYLTGPVYRRCSYVVDKLDGELADFFEDGRKKSEVHYRAGVLHGKLTQWAQDGRVLREQTFADGKTQPAPDSP